jgi:hypothetical protein
MFSTTSSYRSKRVKGIYLHDLSKRLGFSSDNIIELLQDYGFKISKSPTNYLEAEHLDIILKAYVVSVKSIYKSHSKSYKNGKLNEECGWRKFFSNFLRSEFRFSNLSNEDTLEMVFRVKLDDELIADYFWTVLGTSRLSDYNHLHENESVQNKYRYKIKLLVRRNSTIKDFRSQIKLILISSHYYIFSSEDEDSNGSINKYYFSRIINLTREALNFSYKLKLHKKWIIKYETSLIT